MDDHYCLSVFTSEHQIARILAKFEIETEKIPDIIKEIKEIDDNLITATDQEGAELLSFGCNINGKLLKVRYPSLRDWNSYSIDIALLLKKFSTDLDQIDLPNDLDDVVKKDMWKTYSLLLSLISRSKAIRKTIEEIFYKYLRPSIDDMNIDDTKKWITENAPIDLYLRLFTALLVPGEMLKKNANWIDQKIFNPSKVSHSTPLPPKNGNSPKNEQTNVHSSSYHSF